MYKVHTKVIDWYNEDMVYIKYPAKIFVIYKNAYDFYKSLQGQPSSFYPRSYFECLITN